MDVEAIHARLAGMPATTEEYPFGPDALVFKVAGKMFALLGSADDPVRLNLKCDPNEAEALRAGYPVITPGYHMNKRHWNTVALDGTVPDELMVEMIDNSYNLVVRSLPKAEQERLGPMPVKQELNHCQNRSGPPRIGG